VNLTVTLSGRLVAELSALLDSRPEFSTHAVHLALLHLGAQEVRRDPATLTHALTLIQTERRQRRSKANE
jgi:hypothetical protein